MKVIFEDHENALSSQLFRAAYINTADFIYTNGCGNIQNKLEELLAVNPNEHVYIYMDMIPANKSIKAVYGMIMIQNSEKLRRNIL